MYFSKKLLSLVCLGLISVSVMTPLTVEAKQVRSQAAKNSFKASHPCPSNGNRRGSCPGYIIDHIIALACGGADAPRNMQWQTVEESKAKDGWERKDCPTPHYSGRRLTVATNNTEYYTGKNGGCYVYSATGKKRYVDHFYCRN